MPKTLKILSSDDDVNIRTLLFSLLAEQGHHVEFARDGDEVFKHLGRTRYDLLILDVNIPGLNGYKVAQKITGNITNRPKILIFTGRNIEDERLQFVTCGADAILHKGTSCKNILETIEELFPETMQRSTPDTSGDDNHDTADIPYREIPPKEAAPGRSEKMEKDLQYCISRVSQAEDNFNLKTLRYEEFIRDLLKEKQRTEKNYLELKHLETDVIKIKNWLYALAAVTVLTVLRAFF